eukprot:71611-Pleurochrysis_carterae.AAC.2
MHEHKDREQETLIHARTNTHACTRTRTHGEKEAKRERVVAWCVDRARLLRSFSQRIETESLRESAARAQSPIYDSKEADGPTCRAPFSPALSGENVQTVRTV